MCSCIRQTSRSKNLGMATMEGPRVRKLKEALDKALREYCATSTSDGVLQSCFPSLYVTHGAYLHALLTEVVSAVKLNTKVWLCPRPGGGLSACTRLCMQWMHLATVMVTVVVFVCV